MNQSSSNKREIRTLTAQDFRTAQTDSGKTINGTAIVYSSLSEDLGGFREKIAPGAVTASLAANDIFMFFNHEPGKVLGRTSAKTLTLREDTGGVNFECLLPNNSVGNDLAVSMERGDISACSFGFYCEDDSWENAPDGSWLRTINKANVFEVTVCAAPAYPATSAKIRSLFPDGVPQEIRAHVPITEVEVPTIETPAKEEQRMNENACDCSCSCGQCKEGQCQLCSNGDCTDAGCDDCAMRSIRSLRLRARLSTF